MRETTCFNHHMQNPHGTEIYRNRIPTLED